jgi:hypothetical protein
MNTASQKIMVAGFTRGWVNDFMWKASWLGFGDRIPDKPIRERLASWSLKDSVSVDDPGLVLSRVGNSFGLLVGGLPTDYNASRPGPISASFAFLEMDEGIARGLAVAILRNWDTVAKKLVSFITRTNPPTDPEWSIDVDGLLGYVGGIATQPVDGGTKNWGRRERSYAAPGDPRFTELAGLLAGQAFSPDDGVKVLIGKSFSAARSEFLRPKADLVALPGLPPSDSQEPKKKEGSPPGTASQSKISKGPSIPPLPKPPVGVEEAVKWIKSNVKLLVICTIVLLVVLIVGQREKKKSSEQEVVNRPEASPAATASGTTPAATGTVSSAPAQTSNNP